MTAEQISSFRTVDADVDPDPESLDFASAGSAVEPVRPADAQRHQVMQLALPPANVATVGGMIGATLLGGAVGYWLGSRRRPKPVGSLHHLAATVDSAAGLAPIAVRLMANPLVRAMVLRAVAKQLSKRAAS
jgi:hypothetical protein